MRRIAIAGALIAFTFCLAVSVLWLIEARQAKAVIGAWNGRPIANRLVFTDAAAEIGGFPFGLDIRISQAVLTMVDSQARCQAPPLRAHSAIWWRNRFEYETAGRFECRSSGGDEFAIEVPVLHGSVHIAEEALRSATLRAESVHIGGVGDGAVVIGSVDGSLNVTPEHAGDLKSETAHLRLSVEGLALVSDTLASALKQSIERLDLALALTGPPPWGGTLEDLARWRDAGGTLELRQIAGTWLGLTIDGDGTFALDAQMRPEGALTLRLDGLQGTLQRFADDGTLSPQLAELIGERVAELGAPDERVPGRLLIALTAQEGRLTVQDREVGLLSPLTGP